MQNTHGNVTFDYYSVVKPAFLNAGFSVVSFGGLQCTHQTFLSLALGVPSALTSLLAKRAAVPTTQGCLLARTAAITEVEQNCVGLMFLIYFHTASPESHSSVCFCVLKSWGAKQPCFPQLIGHSGQTSSSQYPWQSLRVLLPH